jgi:hypothetical protein
MRSTRASAESRPRNAPRGTRPIDQSNLSREQIYSIKSQIGARARDWVGVSPDGRIVTSDPATGEMVDHGPASDYFS